MGAEAHLRGRLGEDREAGCLARWARGSRSSRSVWRPAMITPAIASPMWPAISSRTNSVGSRSTWVTAVSGRPSRPSRASGSVAVTAPSTGIGESGSRKGTFRWTGPGRISPRARAIARQATERMWRRPESSASWVPTSQNQRTDSPKVLIWSMVWPARSRAAPAVGRRSARSAAAPIRRPRRSPGDSWRAPYPRYRAARSARPSPAPPRGRRRRPSARRRSPSPRSPAPATAPPPAASIANRGRRPPASPHRAPTPRRRPTRGRCWRWSVSVERRCLRRCGEKLGL